MQTAQYKQLQYKLVLHEIFDESQKYPLILHFHGAGARGTNLEVNTYPDKLEAYLREKKLNCGVISPLCEFNNWYMCFSELIEFVDYVSTLPWVDTNRIYLIGSSMGGYAAWSMLMCRPERFAAASPLCGGGMYWNAERIKNIPLRIYHGVQDETVLVTESIHMAEALRKVGGKAELYLLSDCGHNVWDPVLYDHGVIEWLLTHTKNHTQKEEGALRE